MNEPTKHEIPPDAQVTDCRGPTCSAKIYWIRVPYKRKRTDGKTHYPLCVEGDGISHWQGCPDAEWFRKGGAKH